MITVVVTNNIQDYSTSEASEEIPMGNIHEAVREANGLLWGQELYDKISERIKPFDFTTPDDLPPARIAERLKALNQTFTVIPWDFERKVTTGAYTCSTKLRNIIKVSKRKKHIKRSIPLIVNTIIHECVHALDCFTSEFLLKHGNNEREGKDQSAPYWIGDCAGKLITGTNTIFKNEIEVFREKW